MKKNCRYIQFGCGFCAPSDWINFDSSPRLWAERALFVSQALGLLNKKVFPKNVQYGDIVKGLPIQQGQAEAVYSSHVLEHLNKHDVPKALENVAKLLSPGGVFRMIVPDLEWRAHRYIDSKKLAGHDAADEFMASCNMAVSHRSRNFEGIIRAAFGNSGHCWMYDFSSMSALLEKSGFVDIRRCNIGDSDIENFAHVEDAGRFSDGGFRELAIEAKLPS